jgi:hypothetical protein
MVIPDLQPADITATLLTRDDYAQAVTPPGFSRRIPPIKTPVEACTCWTRRSCTRATAA